jgi:DNA-binding NarL/FixJ family response regulator
VDRFAEARGPAEEAVAMAVQLGARAEEANARTALGNLGKPDVGLAELEAGHHLAAEAGDVVVMLRAVVNRSDALVTAGRLAEAAAVALSGMGEASLRGLGHQPQTMLACNASEALFALGRWDQAGRISREAEVKALAKRARLRLDPDATAPATEPPTPAEDLGLTPREAEVLALVAAGRSNGQIAQALYISPKTASVHVSNILAKLGVHTRGEAAAVAHRLSLD